MLRYRINNNRYENIDLIPDKCPYCHKSIKPITNSNNFSHEDLEIIFSCPDLNCKKSFIATYEKRYNDYYFNRTNIGTFTNKKFSDEINSISRGFVVIYNQAFFAEQNNLLEICGVGYRKALEFLIKDYLILNNPSEEDNIKRKFLGRCINDYVTDNKVKAVSKRAVWLGNDETHYIRKWSEKNLNDLKKLIQLTVHWIEMEYLTSSFEADMPE